MQNVTHLTGAAIVTGGKRQIKGAGFVSKLIGVANPFQMLPAR